MRGGPQGAWTVGICRLKRISSTKYENVTSSSPPGPGAGSFLFRGGGPPGRLIPLRGGPRVAGGVTRGGGEKGRGPRRGGGGGWPMQRGSAVRERLRRAPGEVAPVELGPEGGERAAAGAAALAGRLPYRRERSLSPERGPLVGGLGGGVRIDRDFSVVTLAKGPEEAGASRQADPGGRVRMPSVELTRWLGLEPREAAPAPGDATAINLGGAGDFPEGLEYGSEYASTGAASTSGLTGTTLGSILDEGEEVNSLSPVGRFPISPQVGRDSIRRGDSKASAMERQRKGVAGEFLCVGIGVMSLLLFMYIVQYAARYGYIFPPEPIDFHADL